MRHVPEGGTAREGGDGLQELGVGVQVSPDLRQQGLVRQHLAFQARVKLQRLKICLVILQRSTSLIKLRNKVY